MPSDRNFTFQLKAEIQKYKARKDLEKTLERIGVPEDQIKIIIGNEEATKVVYNKIAKSLLKERGISTYVESMLDLEDCKELLIHSTETFKTFDVKLQKFYSIVEKVAGDYFELVEWYKELYCDLLIERERRIRAEASIQVNCEGCPAKQLIPCEDNED